MFCGAQTVVSLLQATETKQSVSFIPTNRFNRDGLFEMFILTRVDASHVYVPALALGYFLQSY